jgi:hypothetical protein
MSRTGRPLPAPERAPEAVAEALSVLTETEREKALQALSLVGSQRQRRGVREPVPHFPLPTQSPERDGVSVTVEWT